MNGTKAQVPYRKTLVIADSIVNDIRTGIIPPGRPFMSRAELCERYSVSLRTAHRIQKMLSGRGFIAARNGRSFMVCDPASAGYVPLSEILIVRQVPTNKKAVIGNEVSIGVFKAAKKHHLACREIYLELLDRNRNEIDISGECDPGQGLILHPYSSIMIRGAGYFLKPGLRRVTIHFPLPAVHHVDSDIFDGMNRLLTRAKELGAQSVLFSPLNPDGWNPVTDSMKIRYGELLAVQMGLRATVNTSPDIRYLRDTIRAERPDAVFLTTASAGNEVRSVFPDDREYRPLKLAFLWGKNAPDGFILYSVEQEDIGYAAAELLADRKSVLPYALTRYIKGKLIET